jgi:hypothetical protein
MSAPMPVGARLGHGLGKRRRNAKSQRKKGKPR